MKIVHFVLFLLCTILTLLASSKVCGQGPAFPFKDVPKGHWARPAIEKCLAARVFDKDETFKGDENVSRFDVAQTVDKILQIIRGNRESYAGLHDPVRLDVEFKEELVGLKKRVQSLEIEVSKLKTESQRRQMKIREKN